jgi:rSAM/selenodomain-associated transferase 2
MRISVIIPTLNEAGCIHDTLADIATLREAGHEIIVVDGGSSDATVAVAALHADSVINAPRCRATQMNAGADAATGDVLWFLHADTRVPFDAAPAILSTMENGHAWGRFDVRLSGRSGMLRVVERLMNLRSCVTGIATGDQGIFVSHELFREMHRYPEIPLMEDIALSKSLRSREKPCCVRPCLVTSSRRWEKNGVWRTILQMWWLRLCFALGGDPAKLARRYNP